MLITNKTLDKLVMSGRFGRRGLEHIGNALKANTTLTALRVNFSETPSPRVTARFVEALGENTAIRKLQLTNAPVRNAGAKTLADLTTRPNASLSTLKLDSCSISTAGVVALGNALAHPDCSLEELSLSGNDPGKSGILALAKGMEVNTKLKMLSGVSEDPDDDVEEDELEEEEEEEKEEEEMGEEKNQEENDGSIKNGEYKKEGGDDSEDEMEGDGDGEEERSDHNTDPPMNPKLAAFMKMMRKHCARAERMRRREAGEETDEDSPSLALAQALKKNTTLTALDINDLRLKDGAAKTAWNEYLLQNTSLEILLTHSAMAIEHKTFGQLTHLKVLDVTFLDLGCFLKEYTKLVANSSTLRELVMENNGLSSLDEEEIQPFWDAVGKSTSLKSLDLTDNRGFADLNGFLNVLKGNTTLQSLVLNDNRIDDMTASELPNLIKTNSGIKELYLHDNELSHHVVVDMLKALSENTTLENLILGENAKEMENTGDLLTALEDSIKANASLLYIDLPGLESTALPLAIREHLCANSFIDCALKDLGVWRLVEVLAIFFSGMRQATSPLHNLPKDIALLIIEKLADPIPKGLVRFASSLFSWLVEGDTTVLPSVQNGIVDLCDASLCENFPSLTWPAFTPSKRNKYHLMQMFCLDEALSSKDSRRSKRKTID